MRAWSFPSVEQPFTSTIRSPTWRPALFAGLPETSTLSLFCLENSPWARDFNIISKYMQAFKLKLKITNKMRKNAQTERVDRWNTIVCVYDENKLSRVPNALNHYQLSQRCEYQLGTKWVLIWKRYWFFLPVCYFWKNTKRILLISDKYSWNNEERWWIGRETKENDK